METEEVKPGRDYTFRETTIEHLRNLKPGDMLIFKNDVSGKGWESILAFSTCATWFMSEHKIDQPGGRSWNEFAKYFCREFAWGTENILNSKQVRIIRLKNRLKKKIISIPVECIIVRMIKN